MSPRRKAKREPDTFAPDSMSINAPATSRWSRPVAPADPSSRSVVSSSAAVGSGGFGSVASAAWSSASESASSCESVFTRWATSCMAAISADASPPSRLAAPIAFDAAFCSAFSDSTSGRSARVRSSSSRTRSSRSSDPSRRRESAARTGSGSRRICLRSSMDGGYSEPPPPE